MRARGHIVIGAISGGAFNAAWQLAARTSQPERQFEWSQVLLSASIGACAGLIPDLLEPAIHPHHRGFFHSIVAGVGVGWLLLGRHTKSLPLGVRLVLAAVSAGYMSHLAADATTPRSIRFF